MFMLIPQLQQQVSKAYSRILPNFVFSLNASNKAFSYPLGLVLLLLPEIVLAACATSNSGRGFDDMSFVMCVVACIMYSNVGRAIGVMGVIVLGLGAVFGKVSWGMALTVATGVTVIFGAPNIIYQITNGMSVPCYADNASAIFTPVSR